MSRKQVNITVKDNIEEYNCSECGNTVTYIHDETTDELCSDNYCSCCGLKINWVTKIKYETEAAISRLEHPTFIGNSNRVLSYPFCAINFYNKNGGKTYIDIPSSELISFIDGAPSSFANKIFKITIEEL